ncbi:MAG: branched-chain amino acid ABC transporter permease [Pseudomonadota bacterium]
MTRGHLIAAALCLIALIALPMVLEATGNRYLIGTVTRVFFYAIAAMSLNLILGFGGMISFGHAAYFGVGAYVVGILSFHGAEGIPIFGLPGTENALIAWPLAVLISALAAALIGALALRTTGVYFIMTTLAFAQMLFFLFVSLEQYGGDDGLFMSAGRSEVPLIDIEGRTTFYFVSMICCALFFWFTHALIHSPFGRVLKGIKQNEPRMRALGAPTYTYKLVAFAIAGGGAGLAGVLSANHTEFVSPDILHWTKSGELMIMVILGGLGTLLGPILGAAAFLILEEFLPVIFDMLGLDLLQEHWRIVFGPLLIIVVLMTRSGLHGALFRKRGAS